MALTVSALEGRVYGAVRNATRRDISGPTGYLARTTPFRSASLSGFAGPSPTAGQLQGSDLELYRRDSADWSIAYTVVSYATPIGWLRFDGSVVIPDAFYSRTTSTHQGMVRAWLGSATSPASTVSVRVG